MAKAKKVMELPPIEEQLANMVVLEGTAEELVAELNLSDLDASGRKKKVTVTHEELEAKGLKNKSQVIRYLDSEGFSRSAIAGFLNVRYQHVRNVLITPLKKG
jgi:hypothetical protein